MGNFIRVLVFCLILSVSVGTTFRVLSWKDTTGEYQSSTMQLYATEKDTMDVVFVGNSHCYCAIQPNILWDEYGISAFNMSVSGQDRESAYYHVKEVLKTQSPQVVCVDLGMLTYDGYVLDSNLYRNMFSMKISKNSVELIQASVDKKESLNYITKWPFVHTRYDELKKYDFENRDYSVYGRGGYIDLTVTPLCVDFEVVNYNGRSKIEKEKQDWIDRFIELSKENNFELVFFTSPYIITYDERAVYNAVADYLDWKGIKYIDFIKPDTLPTLNYATDFIDYGHVNYYGAKKVSEFMANYILENYSMVDHRGDAKYDFWNLDSTYAEHYLFQSTLGQVTDYKEYIDELMSMDNLTTTIILSGPYKNSTLDLYGMMIPLDIEYGYFDGGIWVYRDGILDNYLPGDEVQSAIYDLGESTLAVKSFPVTASKEQLEHMYVIDGVCRGSTFGGYTVIVYDEILHQIIDQRTWF